MKAGSRQRTAAPAAFAAGVGALLCALTAPACLSPTGYTREPGGEAGTSGTAGVSGSAGTSGKAGSSGAGVAGTSGISGLAGTTGTGKAGTSGAAGTSGVAGTTGRAGTTGSTGTAGTTGTTGAAGTTGTTGTAGTTGAGGGSVLLSENFETGNVSQWFTSGTGTAMVITDSSDITNHVYELSNTTGKVFISADGMVTWTNEVITARVKILSFNGSSTSYYAGVCGRVADGNNYYCAALRSDGKLAVRADLASSGTTLGSSVNVSPAITTGIFYTVKLSIIGSTINVYLNGTLEDTVTDTTIAAGAIGLLVDNADAVFDDVVVTSQ